MPSPNRRPPRPRVAGFAPTPILPCAARAGPGDGEQLTVRNSPSLVNLALNTTAPAELYHLDGQFPNLEKLVADTLTDRNFGWKLTERPAAIRHVASIVRNDNGQGELAQQNGGAYALVLAGKSPDPRFVLPESYRLDVAKATDEQILYAVGRLMAAYMDSLFFARDEAGAFAGSPYDVFLQRTAYRASPPPANRTSPTAAACGGSSPTSSNRAL